jgi:ectoine hydroxylase-related dioxygenase (phytanoyl-CoA dioxygenase family)
MSCDAVRELYEQGFCEIRGAVSLDWVRQAREFVAAMKPHVKFGGLRCELSFASTEKAFDWRELLTGSDILGTVLKEALGSDFKLLRIGGIASFPDSDDQDVHRDGQPLFPLECSGGVALPPHAVHVWIPIDQYSLAAGATSFYAGTHRTVGRLLEDLHPDQVGAVVRPVIGLGDCIVFDDRYFRT